jgi:transcriptional regulator with PAS, ATPase and Fis domain
MAPPPSTQDQTSPASRAASSVAVLCLVGSASHPPPRSRVARLGPRLAIGRGDPLLTPDLWQMADETVSRRHAVISSQGGAWSIADLGSHNGTVVDRALLRSRSTALIDGAVVAIGSHAAVFRLMSEHQLSAVESEQESPLAPLPTASPILAVTARRLAGLAGSDRPLLLAGETGTGKEVYARAVHRWSGRAGPFFAVNCAELQGSLLESELFGYRRGSHSQASEDKPGLVSSAERGTLLLDEIGEMPQPLQAKLLRFIQDRSYLGLGWLRAQRADVRIIAATQDPHLSLRPDVLARFGAEPFVLPPLRRRVEDIGVLGHHFLAASPTGIRTFARTAFLALCHHPWTLNVRELESSVAEAALLAAARGARQVGLSDLPGEVSRSAPATDNDAAAPATIETQRRRSPRPAPGRDEMVRLLAENGGDIPALARALDRRRELVWRWCRLLGLDPGQFRDPGSGPRPRDP